MTYQWIRSFLQNLSIPTRDDADEVEPAQSQGKSPGRGLFALDAVSLLHSQAAFGIALPLGGAPPEFSDAGVAQG